MLREYLISPQYLEDVRRLRSGDFFFDVPQRIRLRKGNSERRRIIYRFSDENSTLMKMMAFVLHDFDDLFSDSLYSFRIGRHISRLFRAITKLDCSRSCWIIKADIKSFGDTVDPEILMEQLDSLFGESDPALCRFFRALLLRGEFYERESLGRGSTGALSGCALTNFFENIYLLDTDDHIRENSVYYCRFADDIAIFVRSEAEAIKLYGEIRDTFTERGLTFNEEKTMIVPPGEAFDLLGFEVKAGTYHISENSLRKIEWKLRHYADKLVKKIQMGEIAPHEAEQMMIDRVNKYFFGRQGNTDELNWVDWAFSILTDDSNLKRLDACAQDCIRIVGSGGKRTNAKYRVRYKEMRRMGYRTLVHAYHHGYERI